MVKITIFTPTYNRLHTIRTLFESLCQQTCFDFEWLVVDDGSVDGTSEYFKNELQQSVTSFPIRYYKQENGGKHRAINKGLDLAQGEYFFIVDSDDYLTSDSIENILSWIKTINNSNKKFIGICGLKGYSTSEMVGKTFAGDYIDCTSFERAKYNIIGDKSEVFKTSILKKYKFPEFEGENFITEATVWNRIADDGYLIRYFNNINYICEYREDGLTKNIDYHFANNFEGYTLYVKELLTYNISGKEKIKSIMAYGYRGRLNNIPYKNLASRIRVNPALFYFLTKMGILYKATRNNSK